MKYRLPHPRASWILPATLSLLIALTIGCGEPELHSVSGKVTLNGRSYNRLLVYFRPIDTPTKPYNMGVGETDAEGNLALRSTAGMGLARGKYKVFF